MSVRQILSVTIAGLMLSVLGGSAAAPPSVRVVFSFGKVETLRAGGREWQFVRPGMTLDADDLVRMPPISLMRLGGFDGTRFGLLTGVHEAPVHALLLEASGDATDLERGASLNAEGRPAVDVLPAGDPRANESEERTARPLSMEERQRWRDDPRADHPLVVDAARAVRERVREMPAPSRSYPTPMFVLAEELYRAMSAMFAEDAPLVGLFPEGDAAPLFLFADLVEAAGLTAERALTSDGRPFLLIESGLRPDESRRLTANRSLIDVREPGRLLLPVRPTRRATTFLDAWYAGEAYTNAGPPAERSGER